MAAELIEKRIIARDYSWAFLPILSLRYVALPVVFVSITHIIHHYTFNFYYTIWALKNVLLR